MMIAIVMMIILMSTLSMAKTIVIMNIIIVTTTTISVITTTTTIIIIIILLILIIIVIMVIAIAIAIAFAPLRLLPATFNNLTTLIRICPLECQRHSQEQYWVNIGAEADPSVPVLCRMLADRASTQRCSTVANQKFGKKQPNKKTNTTPGIWA